MTISTPAAGPTAAPLLSICCFTWNRAELLRRCLAEAAATVKVLPFEVEFLCLDTGSTDATPAVMAACKDIEGYRPIRFAGRLPEHEALFAAARMARGEFFFWLPDDDRLDPVGLAKAVFELQTDPSAVASFSPQIEVEDGTDRQVGMLNGMHEPLRFARGDLRDATTYLLQSNYHPEMPLCRTDAFRRHVTRPRKSFLGYWLMLSLLQAGDVQIRTEGFFVHRLRPQGGAHDQVQWTYAVDRQDQHRLAFEILLARSGLRDAIAGAIPRRMAGYAQSAASISARAGQWQAALEFSARASLSGVPPLIGGSLGEMQEITTADRVAEEVAERLRGCEDADHVLIAAMSPLAEAVAAVLRRHRLPVTGDRPLVVVGTASDRQWHIGEGVDPWRAVALDDLAAALSIVPGGAS